MNTDYDKGKNKKTKGRIKETLGKLISDEELGAEDAGQQAIRKPQGPYSILSDRTEKKAD